MPNDRHQSSVYLESVTTIKSNKMCDCGVEDISSNINQKTLRKGRHRSSVIGSRSLHVLHRELKTASKQYIRVGQAIAFPVRTVRLKACLSSSCIGACNNIGRQRNGYSIPSNNPTNRSSVALLSFIQFPIHQDRLTYQGSTQRRTYQGTMPHIVSL